MKGWRLRGALRCRSASTEQTALVADPPDRQHRVVLQGAFDPRDIHDRLQRIGGAVLAERLDDDRPEEILTAHYETGHHLAHLRIGAVRRERPRQRRPHELGFLFGQGGQQPRHHLRIGVMLEPAVRRGTQPVVAIVERLDHGVADPGIVESGQHDQRLETDVRILVSGDGFEQRRDCDRGLRTTDGPAGIHPHREVERAEEINRRLDLLRG